jgi:hypothetical protein
VAGVSIVATLMMIARMVHSVIISVYIGVF